MPALEAMLGAPAMEPRCWVSCETVTKDLNSSIILLRVLMICSVASEGTRHVFLRACELNIKLVFEISAELQ